jgi:hypothetical protein
MSPKGKIIFIALLFVAAMVCATRWWPEDRGPVYEGRDTADWVEEALHDKSRSAAFEAVLKIGAPAVPFIMRQGLYGRSHHFHFLSTDRIMYFSENHPRLYRWLKLDELDFCVVRHEQASWLLWCMGTNAQAAIPDVINCLDNCPELHFINAQSLMDTLGEISGTNPAAIPYLTKYARTDYSLNLRAAAIAYQINGQTNLLVETCERLARKDPQTLLDGQELFWFRQDHELNRHIVPLLEKLYSNPQLDAIHREFIVFELQSRTNDARAALARLAALNGTNAPRKK